MLKNTCQPAWLTLSRALSGPSRGSRCLGLVSPSRCYSNNATHSQTIFSGIQPTGVPHLGNYLGALRQWVRIQNEAPQSTTLFFSAVDLHALTQLGSADQRRQYRREVIATFLAIGLDPHRCSLFYQSDVPAHAELHWILSCETGMGWLSRMTQWRSKLSDQEVKDMITPSTNPKNKERMKLGLFSYPVLMSADILLYRTTHVPIGEDQQQHLEFARDCATRFNHFYGQGKDILIEPQSMLSPAKRVKSLAQPEIKMSKSDSSEKGRIMLNDSDDVIRDKVRRALTDSLLGITYDPVQRNGIANLIEMVSHLEGRSCESIAEEFKDSDLRSLKSYAAEVLISHVSPIRERFEYYTSEQARKEMDEITQRGAERASRVASQTMRDVKQAVGL